jgi:hypothetical protein
VRQGDLVDEMSSIEYGEVIDVNSVCDKRSGKSRCFEFLNWCSGITSLAVGEWVGI